MQLGNASYAVITMSIAAACGGASSATPRSAAAPDPEAEFGALERGADYATNPEYTKVSTTPWVSATHGERFVNTYVNQIGLEAYRSGGALPVGTVIVKDSYENENNAPGARGPIFVMERRAAGYNPEHGDWWYGFHWAEPVGRYAQAVGGQPVYWRGLSPRVNYCESCHDNYERGVGGIPEGHRGW